MQKFPMNFELRHPRCVSNKSKCNVYAICRQTQLTKLCLTTYCLHITFWFPMNVDKQIIFNELQVDIFIRTIILKLQGKQF